MFTVGSASQHYRPIYWPTLDWYIGQLFGLVSASCRPIHTVDMSANSLSTVRWVLVEYQSICQLVCQPSVGWVTADIFTYTRSTFIQYYKCIMSAEITYSKHFFFKARSINWVYFFPCSEILFYCFLLFLLLLLTV